MRRIERLINAEVHAPGVGGSDSRRSCEEWSVEHTATWISTDLALPQYGHTIRANHIHGRRLVLLTSPSNLPAMGVTDFEHIKQIVSGARRLLALAADPPPGCGTRNWGAEPSEGPRVAYLHHLCQSRPGTPLTYTEFIRDQKLIWFYLPQVAGGGAAEVNDRRWMVSERGREALHKWARCLHQP